MAAAAALNGMAEAAIVGGGNGVAMAKLASGEKAAQQRQHGVAATGGVTS